VRALVVGTMDLFRLAAQRHPMRSLVGAPLATLTGRACSRLLDLGGSADRTGRWMPDPTQPPTEARPVAALEQTELDLVVLFATLTADFLSLVGDHRDQVAISLLRAVAEDADGFHRAWHALQHDQARVGELLVSLRAERERSELVVMALLTADPDTQLDDKTLHEVRACVHTGQRLTEMLTALTEHAAQTP